jgi:GTP-binding protein
MEDFTILRNELEFYNPELLNRPYLIVANKIDVPEAREKYQSLRDKYGDLVYGISAVTGEGVEELVEKTYALLQSIPPEEHIGETRIVRKFEQDVPFTIEVVDGVYQVSGKRIENLLVMTNFDQDQNLQRFQRTVARMGLDEALKAKGIKEGDTVRIKDMEFNYSE